MSLVVTVYVPEAIVMASDSRQFITVEGKIADGRPLKVETQSSDFASKTFLLQEQAVGINAYGAAMLERLSIESHIRRFAEENIEPSDDVTAVAEKLLKHFVARFPGQDTAFHVAGFKTENRMSLPYVYDCHVGQERLARRNVRPDTEEVVYGAQWGGQSDVLSRLLNVTHIRGAEGAPQPAAAMPIVWDAMNVQDAIDFAIYAIRTTIDTIRFEARPKNVGGPIDVLALLPSGSVWVQRKHAQGEVKHAASVPAEVRS